MKRKMQETYSKDVFVIPNGIEPERFYRTQGDEIRVKLEIKVNQKLILFVGRLHPVKGVKYLIKAMDIVRQKKQRQANTCRKRTRRK
jgi:glycosyltransferase involved in cell wall biosynthesis